MLLVITFVMSSCQKDYVCVCTNLSTGEKSYGDRVKTTKLGKKGFEKSCKSKSTAHKECFVE